MSEKWHRWEPIAELSGKYFIDSIAQNFKGFEVFLSYNNKKIRVLFEQKVLSFQHTDESFRLGIPAHLNKFYEANFYKDWTFFKVENSSYVKWLSDESGTFSDVMEPIHFSFIAADSILDVISVDNPKVEFVNSPWHIFRGIVHKFLSK